MLDCEEYAVEKDLRSLLDVTEPRSLKQVEVWPEASFLGERIGPFEFS